MSSEISFESLPQELQEIFIADEMNSGSISMLTVSKGWKQCVENFTARVIIPQLKHLETFLMNEESKYSGMGFRVVRKLRYLSFWSVQQFAKGMKNNSIPVAYIFQNYRKIYSMLPLLADYLYHKWSIVDLASVYHNPEKPLPKILQDIPAFVNKALTPEMILNEFSKIDLVSLPKIIGGSRYPTHPETIMNRNLLYLHAGTFRKGKSKEDAVAYLYGGGVDGVITALLTKDELESFNTLSMLYEEGFEEREIRFRKIISLVTVTPFEDIFNIERNIYSLTNVSEPKLLENRLC